MSAYYNKPVISEKEHVAVARTGATCVQLICKMLAAVSLNLPQTPESLIISLFSPPKAAKYITTDPQIGGEVMGRW